MSPWTRLLPFPDGCRRQAQHHGRTAAIACVACFERSAQLAHDIADEEQPEAAAATPLREALNAQGQFKSPQIENVGESRSPAQLQVRYTYPVDESAAQIVVDALKDQPGCGRGDLELKRVYMGRFQGKTDKGVIEVWWPRSTVAKQEPPA